MTSGVSEKQGEAMEPLLGAQQGCALLSSWPAMLQKVNLFLWTGWWPQGGE